MGFLKEVRTFIAPTVMDRIAGPILYNYQLMVKQYYQSIEGFYANYTDFRSRKRLHKHQILKTLVYNMDRWDTYPIDFGSGYLEYMERVCCKKLFVKSAILEILWENRRDEVCGKGRSTFTAGGKTYNYPISPEEVYETDRSAPRQVTTLYDLISRIYEVEVWEVRRPKNNNGEINLVESPKDKLYGMINGPLAIRPNDRLEFLIKESLESWNEAGRGYEWAAEAELWSEKKIRKKLESFSFDDDE